MNTYACWHQGRPGFCFEHPRSGWWFVPEQGQPDNEIRRYLALEDFLFANRIDWQLEYDRRQIHAAMPWWRRSLQAVLSPARPRSVAGLLLLPMPQL